MEFTKAGVLGEINYVLDNELMSKDQLLDEMLGAPSHLFSTSTHSFISSLLDNEWIREEQLLDEMLGAMTADQLKEIWEYIKRNWEIEDEG